LSLWKVIAKNEIRLKTSRFRRNRKLFFIVLFSVFLFWATYFGPALFDAILPETIKSYSNIIEPYITPLIELSFMKLFLFYIMSPLFMLYRRSEIGHKDFLLATPIKPADIFLGEFIGQLPFNFLIILGIGPFLNSLLLQIKPNMMFYHHLIFYIITFVLLVFGLLLGTLLAIWLERKMAIKSKLNRLSYPYLCFLTILIIIFFYFFHFFPNFVENNPELKEWLIFYPSYWYSNILIYLINPVFIESYFLNIWLNIGLAIIIPLLIFYISYKKIHKTFDLGKIQDITSTYIKKEEKTYDFLRKITPQKYRNLIITQLKVFVRKKENIPKLIYIGVITAILGSFMFFSLDESLLNVETFMVISPFVAQILYFKYLLVMILSWIGGLIFSIFIGFYVLISSKNILFLYRKSIRGPKALIYSFFYLMVYLILLFDIILTIFFSILFPLDYLTALTFFFFYFLVSLILLIQAIGIQCIRPLFDERGKNIFFNVYIIIVLQVISLFIAIFIVVPIVPLYIDHSLGLLYILLITTITSLGFAFILLYFGIRKLNRIE